MPRTNTSHSGLSSSGGMKTTPNSSVTSEGPVNAPVPDPKRTRQKFVGVAVGTSGPAPGGLDQLPAESSEESADAEDLRLERGMKKAPLQIDYDYDRKIRKGESF